MSDLRKVPELSLLSFVNGNSHQRKEFVDGLFKGLQDYGFIILVDHTVDPKVIDQAYKAVKSFFSLPTEIKMKYGNIEGGQRGYNAFGVEHAKDSDKPDLKEFWHTGRDLPEGHRFQSVYPDNVWPSEVADFKNLMLALYNELDKTAGHILDALGMALDVPQEFFRNMSENGNSILRSIYYPAMDQAPPEGSVRAAAHEDINLITLLMGATASGLELLDRDGKWLAVETKEGQLVVDSGDMMSRLTNEVIPATTHRVVNPKDFSTERFSMPYFVHPNPETVLKCIPSCVGEGEKFEPINSHEFLQQRLREIGLLKKY